jgi:hypothetical protein
MREFSKLSLQVAAFLKIEIDTIVDGGDHDLFTTTTGEEDEREVAKPFADRFLKCDPIHIRHLVI